MTTNRVTFKPIPPHADKFLRQVRRVPADQLQAKANSQMESETRALGALVRLGGTARTDALQKIAEAYQTQTLPIYDRVKMHTVLDLCDVAGTKDAEYVQIIRAELGRQEGIFPTRRSDDYEVPGAGPNIATIVGNQAPLGENDLTMGNPGIPAIEVIAPPLAAREDVPFEEQLTMVERKNERPVPPPPTLAQEIADDFANAPREQDPSQPKPTIPFSQKHPILSWILRGIGWRQ